MEARKGTQWGHINSNKISSDSEIPLWWWSKRYWPYSWRQCHKWSVKECLVCSRCCERNSIDGYKISWFTSWSRKIATGFKEKSGIGLTNCVVAIDGLLVWIHKPNKADLEKNIGFGPKKFFCGRKMKYGLNMMGSWDSRRYFIDVEIRFPGSSSGFYAFLNSNLREKLEQEGFLANGLCLYGDNAYVDTDYMIVPFKGALLDEAKDAFNFSTHLYELMLNAHLVCWYIDEEYYRKQSQWTSQYRRQHHWSCACVN